MSNHLNWVEIKNFKSIKDLRLDCKRVNVFIGKPNVGKSNILEGLGLLGVSYTNDKYLSGTVRYEMIRELFRDSDPSESIQVLSNKIEASLERRDSEPEMTEEKFDLKRDVPPFKNLESPQYRDYSLTAKGEVEVFGSGIRNYRKDSEKIDMSGSSPVRKYDFANLLSFKATFSDYLLPPNGSNLYAVINRHPELWKEFAVLFENQGLEFILSDHDQTFVLQKREGFKAKQYPFFSIADTFRRYMFYIAAIESNKYSVIIFEEPEVHSFPPYTQQLAQRMIYSETNQFFVSTHSPYLLHTLIENLEIDDLNVYITYYENYQSKVHALTADDLRHILDFSTDVFFNLDKFIPNAHSVAA